MNAFRFYAFIVLATGNLLNNAGEPFVHIRNHEPLATRKNQNELLLQEDTLLPLLQCKHLFTPSNFTSVACLVAPSEGRLYRSYIDFSRTDIPSSQYNKNKPILGRKCKFCKRVVLASKGISVFECK